MSRQIVYSCDRCGKTASEDIVRREWIEVAFGHALSSAMVAVDGGHVCGECIAPFADFFAKSSRARFGAYASHPAELDMSIEERVSPKQSAMVETRAQYELTPERLIILGQASDWIVHDIRIGRRSQFVQAGDVPGDLFAEDAQVGPISFETIQTIMDVALLVSYRGDDPEGAVFRAKFVGRERGFAPDPTKLRAPARKVEFAPKPSSLATRYSSCEVLPSQLDPKFVAAARFVEQEREKAKKLAEDKEREAVASLAEVVALEKGPSAP
jgi:hypothetical protein